MRKLTLALGAIAALCCLSFFGLAQAQTPPVTFSVYPVPGTLTASAKTQITLPRRRRRGDRHGHGQGLEERHPHRARCKPHSDGQGASFVPDKPFTRGREGHGHHRPHDRRRHRRRLLVRDRRRDAAHAAPGRGAERRPRRRPVLRRPARTSSPPAVTVTTNKPGTAPGLVFLAPKARPRPGRPDDHRQRGPARLVQADAGQDRRRLPRPDLPGQARADLVGGRSCSSATATASARSTTPATSPVAHGPHRQRLLVRPARVHDHAAQHRAGARLRALQARA